MTSGKDVSARTVDRHELKTKVEFFVDGDIETATSVDVSEGGIRFDTHVPVKVRMRFNVEGELREYLSRLVWAKRNDDGTMAYGFEFIPDDEECVF